MNEEKKTIDLNILINNNKYIKKCKQNTKNIKIDENSLSFLIKNICLSQSDKIKLGIALESILRDLIIKTNSNINFTCIKEKNKKGENEKDHLFINHIDKIVYYAEIKSNLNLDTEKIMSTINKCLKITQELQ